MGAGGYRRGSGRSKSGYYNGIYCGSTYELCWLIHALDTGVKFSRFEGVLTDGITTYIPDFILDDSKTIIELRYEQQDSVNKKTKLAERLGYTVIVLRKDDLKDVFDYVAKKFGTREFHTLYDGYKPKYEYQCFQCNCKVLRDKQSKKKLIFCSRSCSMKYNRLQISPSTISSSEKAKQFYYKNKDKVLARRRELYKLKRISNLAS